jgi:hypothetical protein
VDSNHSLSDGIYSPAAVSKRLLPPKNVFYLANLLVRPMLKILKFKTEWVW